MVDRPLRIGFLTTEYPTEGYTGGIGSYVRQITQSLTELGHSTFVLLAVPSGEGVSWDGAVPIHRICLSGLASRLPEPFGRGASLSFARMLSRIANELNLDLLEAPEWSGLTAFLSLVKPPKLSVIVRLHTCSSIVRRINKVNPTSIRERLDWRKRDWLEKRSILTANAVTAVSKAIGEETRQCLGVNRYDFQVVPNSVNDSAFVTSENAGEEVNSLVLFIGRLEWRKGPDLLIRAVPEVLKQRPGVLFRFAGMDTATGPGSTSMMTHLESLLPSAMRSNVDFCGHLASSQIPESLQRATVCVFPSRYEGLPMVCLEAMAHGKAIVVADIPGFRELISDGETGLIVNGENPESWASALVRLLSDGLLRVRLGNAARDAARTYFHGNVVAKAMVRVYRASIASTESCAQNLVAKDQGLQ